MNQPLISILMPVYNAAPFLEKALDSLWQQTLTDFEIVVVDDGSTDFSIKIIESVKDPRLHLVRQPHTGIAAALNRGIQHAKAPLIARFDADDICLPERLQLQYDFLSMHPDHVICGGNAEYVDVNGDHLFDFESNRYTNDEILNSLYQQCPFIHSSVMYRKDAVIKAGGYSQDAHNFEDYLLWVQMAASGKFANLPEQLIKVRFNPHSVTIDEKWRGERFRSLKRKVIQQGYVTQQEGEELRMIIEKQDLAKLKEGAYYALCGKKFLVDNHQPGKARRHLVKAIRTYPFRWDNYLLYAVSFMPASWIEWLHRKSSYQSLSR